MKLVDKLKNALFEEEYVEVEEKPKKLKKKEQKKVKTPKKEKEVEEKPIAKKIVLPERKEVRITTHEDKEKEELIETKKEESIKIEESNDFKFPIISDNEFTYQKEDRFKMPQVDNIESPKREEPKKKVQFNDYERKSKPYGLDDVQIKESEYGIYEKKEERTYFKPSPIISPIYGILDKNYTKDDIVQKKEVRLTSSYSRGNLNVDEVRNRAYGITDSVPLTRNSETKREYETETSSIMDNDLLDLSVETPEVSRVTVGDAEEYFEDLGLEYNVDYKDTSNEKRVSRYSEKESVDNINNIENNLSNNDEGPYIVHEEISKDFQLDNKVSKVEEIKPNIINENASDDDDLDEDNLFDLIDSMYEKE